MITKILSEYQRKVKIELNSIETKCGYSKRKDTIFLNLSALHENKTNFKKDLKLQIK